MKHESLVGSLTQLSDMIFKALVKVAGHYTEGTKFKVQDTVVEKILYSSLLSGGISLTHLYSYSEESRAALRRHWSIIGDSDLLITLNSKDTTGKDPIIHKD